MSEDMKSQAEMTATMARINALRPKMGGMNPAERIDFICDTLDFSDEQRRDMKQSMVAAKAAWLEARNGVVCECGEIAGWLFKKTAKKIEGLGFDIFHFKCSDCGKEIDRPWRAPTLDNKNIEPYVTRYNQKGEEDGTNRTE